MSELNKILKKHLLPRGGNRWNILGGIDNLMIEVDKYEKSKVKENELLHSVSQQRELLESFVDYAQGRSLQDINIDDDTINYFLEDSNCS